MESQGNKNLENARRIINRSENRVCLLPPWRLCRNDENAAFVILNEVKNLMDSIRYTTQILRLPPQNDITTQSLAGEGKDEGTLIGTLTSILSRRGRGSRKELIQRKLLAILKLVAHRAG